MATITPDELPTVWRSPPLLLGLSVLAIAFVLLAFRQDLWLMVTWWYDRPEYSHGFLIPLVSLYLVWDKRNELAQVPFTGSWWGVAIAAVGIVCGFVGNLASIYTVVQYSFLLVFAGAVLALLGVEAFKRIWVAVVILFFMVPLPNFLYNNLSSQLQLWSSEIGVAVIRMFGVSVHLEGNVIDLGSYKLQVVEACNGLRYLFPLMTLGVIMAYLYRGPLWARVVVFLSTMPITVLMNSFRIGVIGVLVEYFGEDQAEGFLHDFEGWVIFMACFGVLMLEILVLSRLAGDRRPFSTIFGLDPPAELPAQAQHAERAVHLSTKAAAAVLVLGAGAMLALPYRGEIIPERALFADFPSSIAGWQGRRDELEQQYIDALKFTDYLLMNLVQDNRLVNLYVAYYESQRKGESVHSPRSCIPGGGWRIESLTTETLERPGTDVLNYNRVLISLGNDRQLVYYWFEGRGRHLTNEYLVKWFIFWDSLTRRRTDGALVRVTTPVGTAEEITAADARLREFVLAAAGELEPYLPR